MNRSTQLEHRASSRLGKHEGEPSLGLCDRLDRTRDNSQRQLPTDHDYAVPTCEYQTDQSSLKPAQTAARFVLEERQRQLQKQPHRSSRIDRVTPYQAYLPFNRLPYACNHAIENAKYEDDTRRMMRASRTRTYNSSVNSRARRPHPCCYRLL